VLDVTVSRGNTLSTAVKYLIDAGVPAAHIRCGCILVSKEGVSQFHKNHPGVEVFAIGQDSLINDRGHIIPGVGNPSARMFRTHEANATDLEEVFE
jgi:uracil phosphoribosyltransferase